MTGDNGPARSKRAARAVNGTHLTGYDLRPKMPECEDASEAPAEPGASCAIPAPPPAGFDLPCGSAGASPSHDHHERLNV